MSTVTCARCRSVVPQSESVFSRGGDVLCRHCGVLEEAHAQLDRAAETAAHGGNDGMTLDHDHNASKSAHAALERVATVPALDGERSVRCARCARIVAQRDTSFDTAGNALCATCGEGFDVGAAQATARQGQYWKGAVLLLLAVGVALLALARR
jgi:endogenous inhibitor of DNA gyrase (YacG/DUF329 family)